MPTTPDRALFGAVASLALAATLLTGCSAGKSDKTPPAASPASEAAPSGAQAAPGEPPIGVSPGGVTTRIDEPAQSTEEQYAQSCLAAKKLLTAKGGNLHDHVEPLLKDVQSSKDPSAITFTKSWAELSTAQQAAVIIAVKAASDGGC
jgi:hypothetical protein